jgi:hypothetical protein
VNAGETRFNADNTVNEDLFKDRPVAINGGQLDVDTKGPVGEVKSAIAKGDLTGARAAIDKIEDPQTKEIAKAKLSQAYIGDINDKSKGGVFSILTKPESEGGYGFTGDEAKAIMAKRGLINFDLSSKDDLKLETAEANFREFGGFDDQGKPTQRISRDRIKTEVVKFYRDNLPGEMARMGMKEDEVAKYMASQGYLGEEESLSSEALGKMRSDYAAAVKTKGDKTASDALATKWIDAGKGTGIPTGVAGDQYQVIKGNVRKMYKPDGASEKPDPDIDAARNRLHTGDQQKKTLGVQERGVAAQEEANDIRREEIATNKELKREELKQNKQIADERLAFDKENADENRKLQREQMQMQLIQTVLQIFSQLVGSAMQILGQTAAAHISGQYQVQAGIMQKFKNS